MKDRSDKRSDKNEQDIEALALDHTFGELTFAQQAIVLEQLGSEQAYDRLRSLLLMTRRELRRESGTIQPHPEIRSDLLAAMRERNHAVARRRFRLRDLLGYPVPAYTSIAGFATAVVLALMLGQSSGSQQPVVHERVVYLPADNAGSSAVDRNEIVRQVTDSLKAELAKQPAVQPSMPAARRPADITSPRIRKKPGSGMIDQEPARVPARTAPVAPGNQFVGLANLPQLDVQKRGKNLAEDSSSRPFGWTAARDSF